jgi:phospholipase C
LTARDAAANDVTPLLSLDAARTDAPTQLPEPAQITGPQVAAVTQPDKPVDKGNLPAFLHVAMRADMATAPPEAKHDILSRVQAIQTRGQAARYIQNVQSKIQAAKAST